MASIIRHIKRWNVWRKNNLNGRFYQLLVLFKIKNSPSMSFIVIAEDGCILDYTKAVENFNTHYEAMRAEYISSQGGVDNG